MPTIPSPSQMKGDLTQMIHVEQLPPGPRPVLRCEYRTRDNPNCLEGASFRLSDHARPQRHNYLCPQHLEDMVDEARVRHQEVMRSQGR